MNNLVIPKKNKDNVTITHQGKWKLFDDIEIDCYVTSKKQRLLSLRGTARAMDLKGGGSGALLRTLNLKWIQPYLSDHLKEWILRASSTETNKIEVVFGSPIIPFEASLFVDVCKAYILASNDNALTEAGVRTYKRLLSLMTAFAKVGIDSLVDEITGYQEDRKSDELEKILRVYLCEEFLKWTRIFPDEFYEQMFRLKGWKSFKKGGQKMPQVVGFYTNDVVYERLPDGVLKALKEKVPKSESGNNLMKLHQGLSEEYGRKHLEKHLIAVIALMRATEEWEEFLYMLDKSYLKLGQSKMRLYG